MQTLHLLTHGLDLAPFALFLNRITLGLFYVLARFRFFYDPSKPTWSGTNTRIGNQRWLNKQRHESLTNKMAHCGFKKHPRVWAWSAALIEVGGGLWLILGVFPAFAAFGLLVLTLFATRCTAKAKVFEQNPVDCIDICSCYLWRVEGLYIIMALIVVLGGPGAFVLT